MTVMMKLYKKKGGKAMVRSPDGDTNYRDMAAGVLQEHTHVP